MKNLKQLILIPFLLVCVDTFAQQPIFATIAGGDLYSFNLKNCTRRFVGSTGQGFGDIAFTPDGRLWGIVGGQLYQIDTTTANATLIGETGLGSITLVGLNDSILLAEYGMKLYGIDNRTAASYYIDTIGYGASGDLTWYDNDLYIITPVVRIKLNSTNTAILSVTPINLSGLTCEGAVTTSFPGDYNSIVGFNGPNLYKICQIDGTYEMLCPALNINGTPGAASLRLAIQHPQPTVCHISSAVSNATILNSGFEVFPNPATDELNVRTIDNQQFKFNIYNALGQSVKTGILETGLTTIRINNLRAGIYSIELSGGNKTERHCFIVNQ